MTVFLKEEGLPTIARALSEATSLLKEQGSPTPSLDARLLMAHTLGLSHAQLILYETNTLTKDQLSVFEAMLHRRLSSEPIAYILGYQDFMDWRFVVTRDVLIPRPDTELVMQVVASIFTSRAFQQPPRFLDIGTGSGCLAISLQKIYAHAYVDAWDLSGKALDVARLNAEQLECGAIRFFQKDALSLEPWSAQIGYDVIVSNPPYIASHEAPDLDASVCAFEPHAALFAEEDGLRFYRHYAEHGFKILREKGCLILEVGYAQAGVVAKMFQEKNHWGTVSIHKDLNGIERVVVIFSKESS